MPLRHSLHHHADGSDVCIGRRPSRAGTMSSSRNDVLVHQRCLWRCQRACAHALDRFAQHARIDSASIRSHRTAAVCRAGLRGSLAAATAGHDDLAVSRTASVKCTPIHIEQITDAQRLAARPSWRVRPRRVSRSGQNVTFCSTHGCTNPHMPCAGVT